MFTPSLAPSQRRYAKALRSAASTVTLLALTPALVLAKDDAGGPPTSDTEMPGVIINEVLFDQMGTDADAKFGAEYVELYTTRDVDLSTFSIQDGSGTPFPAFPSTVVPANTYVLVGFCGLGVYELDETPHDGTYAFTLGIPPGDILPNAQTPGSGGGIRLCDSGYVVDSIYWGHGAAPAGSGGVFFDVSFAGGRPMNEGDSIGRSATPAQSYTGSLADWERNGGENAAGPTPKQRNGIAVLDGDNSLKWAQAGVCQIMNAFASMTEQNNKYRFVNSSVANVSVNETAQQLTVTADHTFHLLADGQPQTLNGSIVTTLIKNETPGSVAYYQTAQGTLLSSSTWSFDINYARLTTGLHTNVITAQTQTNVTYRENGVDYPYSCSVTKHFGRTSDQQWMMGDQRIGVDYGNAGNKTSNTLVTFDRQSDGVLASHFDMTRDMPMGPPKPGQPDGPSYTQHLITDCVTQGDDLGTYTTSVSRYDEFKDNVLVVSLQPGKTGSSRLRITPASTSEPFGAAYHTMSLPFLINGQNHTITSGTRGEVDITGGRYVAKASTQINVDGFLVNQFTIYADPPLQQGSGKSSTSGEEGFGDAAVNCAAKGGAIGAGVGATVGAVTGAIGGASVGGTIGFAGGPAVSALGVVAGGVKGAAKGTVAGSAAGGIAGGGIGAAVCMTVWVAERVPGAIGTAWDWVTSWF